MLGLTSPRHTSTLPAPAVPFAQIEVNRRRPGERVARRPKTVFRTSAVNAPTAAGSRLSFGPVTTAPRMARHYLGVDVKVTYCPNWKEPPLVGRPRSPVPI